MATLVSLDAAKRQLSLGTRTDLDVIVQQKLDSATAIVVDYISATAYWRTIAAAWTDVTVPAPVSEAILRQLSDLYEYRGDDSGRDRDRSSERMGYLAPDVATLLWRYRDQVLA